MIDQAISSLSNSALTILVARSVSSDAFGAFALSFTVYQFLIAATRSLTGQPLAVRHSSSGPPALRDAVRSSTGFTVSLGAVCGVVGVSTGLLLGGETGRALIAMGIVLPGVLLQDTWRSVFIVAGKPSAAAWNDTVWTVAQLLGVVWLIRQGSTTGYVYVLAWGASGALAAALAGRQFGARPSLRATARWLHSTWDLSRFFLAAGLAVNGASQLTLIAAASFGTVDDVGAIRAAQVLLGPVGLVAISVLGFCLPEFSRRPWLTARQQLTWGLVVSLGLALVGLVWGLGLLLLPGSVGTQLLGDTWAQARSALPGSVAAAAGLAIATGPVIILRAHERVQVSLQISLVLAIGTVAFGLAGLEAGGAAGLAWGIAVASWAAAPVWWWQALRFLRESVPHPATARTP